jgi:hypothetical protein
MTGMARARAAARLIRRFARMSAFERRMALGPFERPAYAYCVYHSALLAKQLGYSKISAIEFGVAGGNGLRALERYARITAERVGIGIDVYGFDTGTGLPAPDDYRDLPYHWKPGFFGMDEDRLRAKLGSAELILGDIAETASDFFRIQRPAPIAAVIHDLDYYSSTAAALRMFDVSERFRIPRIYCYFDDIVGSEIELYNDYTGERLAIDEFNRAHTAMKLSKAYHLVERRRTRDWYYHIFILHDFAHSRYNDFVSLADQQRPLR